MGQALYRKYRSRSFDEVVGQDHITKPLKNALKTNKISHAYLFAGPRGVGKTSVARILAYAVNDIPYKGEGTELDIIEIDAASNRRIDEIRDLREKVHIAPTSAKYKVYIIDEVHMLTREAFNALLKTLEEPPQHCVFILATTEAHKLPETIISRTQRYNFRPVARQDAIKHLESIAQLEKLNVDQAALELLAEFGEGSFRDSISLLDQMANVDDTIDAELVRQQLGLPKNEEVRKLLDLVDTGQPAKLLDVLEQLLSSGNDAANIAKLLSKILRERVRDNSAQVSDIELLKSLQLISASLNPPEALEIALLEAASGRPTKDNVVPIEQPMSKPGPKPTKETATARRQDNFDLAMWEDVLAGVKKEAPSLYTALRLASPAVDNNRLTLTFEFPFHQKKVDQASAKDIICSVIEKLSSVKVSLECVVDKALVEQNNKGETVDFYKQAGEEPANLNNIHNIFGTVEVLESD